MKRTIILDVFAQWVTAILRSVPARLRPTLAELFIGCIISPKGHITSALQSIRYALCWSSYHNAIQEGAFSWKALVRGWLDVILSAVAMDELLLVIDDSILMRSSKKAPGVDEHYDHANRANRPRFLRGQLLVCASVVLQGKGRIGTVPLLQSLSKAGGNATKLQIAAVLHRRILRWLAARLPVRVMADAWYMKGPFIHDVLRKGSHALGMVRSDTALKAVLTPEQIAQAKQKRKGPGRAKKYGEKLTLKRIKELFVPQRFTAHAYSKERHFEAYCFDAHVVFLKHRICRMVWCRMENKKLKDGWTRWHLILSTDLDAAMDARRIVNLYAMRWWIEPEFHEIKFTFGLKEAWQQSRIAFDRWRTMLCIAYGIAKLMAIVFGDEAGKDLAPIAWRTKGRTTAGWVSHALHRIFYNSEIRSLWDRKQQKFVMPFRDSA
ncbi:transposase [Desulfurispirillum indicum]|uniref:IS701 family transposase n=1 Tax=Desulfurispirillum indicum TaxID=936456 RepID=UPI001CFB1DE1|nr:transposase [Desulfurispirillum indicum]UCZ55620.1 transposase [Desulfurispirillum indicum]UCZ55749.1 transposase [Desulfurispirillum indicum]